MSRKRYLRVRNFDEQLHYKDKNPIWIKLYCSLLEDYALAQVADETKFHAVGLMILAGRLNNQIPEDEPWLRQKINANTKIDLKLLLEIGFLEPVKSSRSRPKSSFNDGNIKKTNTDDSRALFETALDQNRTEENRKEQNTTQQNTAEQNTADETRDAGASGAAAENRAVLCVAERFSENQNGADQNRPLKKVSPPVAGEHLSQFTLEECLRYVEKCRAKGDAIKSPKALATNLFQTGNADAFILAALYPEKLAPAERAQFGEPRKFSDEPCTVCFGSKMEIVQGKGARPCQHCRSEKGKATGFEPLSEDGGP